MRGNYAGPKVNEEDFVISNYVDLHAIREREERRDTIIEVLFVVGIVVVISLSFWVLLK